MAEKGKVLTMKDDGPPPAPPPEPPRPLWDRVKPLFYIGLAGMVVLCGLGLGGLLSVTVMKESPPEVVSGGKIAVLPFTEQSEGGALLADAVHAEVVTALSGVKGLEVLPLADVQKLKGDARKLDEIGAALGVRYVAEGAVKVESGSVVLNVTVANVPDKAQALNERYTRPTPEIYGAMDGAVRDLVKMANLPTEGVPMVARPTDNGAAWERALTGAGLCAMGGEGVAKGVEAANLAIQADAKYLEPHLVIAECWVKAAEGGVPPKDAHAQANAALKAALTLDPKAAELPRFAAIAAKTAFKP